MPPDEPCASSQLARKKLMVSNLKLWAVVLAAGEGTRMRSQRPKPLHRLCGRPMVAHVLDALAELRLDRVVVVVGHEATRVMRAINECSPEGLKVSYADQRTRRGTGDAVLKALDAFPEVEMDDGDVLVLPGDTPLLRPPTIAALVRKHREEDAAATILTARVSDPSGYGRVDRDKAGRVARIVEHADADEQQRAIDEVNTSIYVFRRSVLGPALRRLTPDNAAGELYLTDVIAVLHDAGYPVSSMLVEDPTEAAGVNDRHQLAAAEAVLRARLNERWMRRGVTMIDPESTYVDASVELSPDVVLYPGTLLQGSTRVEEGAEIGPYSQLRDCQVGRQATVIATIAEGAEIGEQAQVGPWAFLPPGTKVKPGAVAGPGFGGE